MDKKIIKNFVYNMVFQVLTLLLPFITIPYISRVLSPEDIGLYGSSYSFVQIFCIIGTFAINSYGVKIISNYRDSKENLSLKFYELRFVQKVTMGITIGIYFLFIAILKLDHKYIYFIQGIYLIASLIDISWIFMGIEDFKKTVTRNMIVKLVSLLLIFIFVKDSTHLIRYTLILSMSVLLGNASMWVYLNNIIIKVKTKTINIKYHLINAFSLLIPQLCFQIYTSFDRTILGIVSSMEQVGLFDQSQKIIRISVGLVTSLGIVMLPRISYMIANNSKSEEIHELLKKSLNLTLFISIGCTFGIISISNNFVPWFFGSQYGEVEILLKLSSFVCFFTALGSFLSNQYAIPKNDKVAYIVPLLSAACISILLNILLGWKYEAVGACIAILVTELIALLLRLYFLRTSLSYSYLFKDLIIFIVSGSIMYLSIVVLRKFFLLEATPISTIIEIGVGGIVYCSTLLVLNRQWLEILEKKIITSLMYQKLFK